MMELNDVLHDRQSDARAGLVVDREGITKIVSNLLTNALKYTSNHVSLECRVSAGGSHFVIEVSDNGIGISPKEQQKIFSPFYQARSPWPLTSKSLRNSAAKVGLAKS